MGAGDVAPYTSALKGEASLRGTWGRGLAAPPGLGGGWAETRPRLWRVSALRRLLPRITVILSGPSRARFTDSEARRGAVTGSRPQPGGGGFQPRRWRPTWGWGSNPLMAGGWQSRAVGSKPLGGRGRVRLTGHQDGQLPGPQPRLPSLPSRRPRLTVQGSSSPPFPAGRMMSPSSDLEHRPCQAEAFPWLMLWPLIFIFNFNLLI